MGDDKPSPSSASRASKHLRGLFHSQGAAIAILLVLLGALLTYLMTGVQATRGEAANEAARMKHDRNTPPVRAESVTSTYNQSVSSAHVLDLDGVKVFRGQDSPLPVEGRAEVGQINAPRGGSQTFEAQPQVYARLNFTLVGQHYEPVRITSISAVITSRRAPLSGTLLYAEPEGADTAVGLGFDLDSTDQSAKELVDDSSNQKEITLGDDYFAGHQLTLGRGEPVTFEVFALTSKCRCDFTLKITFASGTPLELTDDRQPWHVSAFAPAFARSYFYDMTRQQVVLSRCKWPAGCQRLER